MSEAVSVGALICIALECAILIMILWDGLALPAFAAFLSVDVVFSLAMQGVTLTGAGWMTPQYLHWYGLAFPFVLGLLTVAAVEAVGAVPREAACAVVALVVAAMLITPAPVETRCAILGCCAATLIVSLSEKRSTHAALLLAFILTATVESLAICLGETGSLRPAAFLVAGQLVPLVGWLVWIDRLAAPKPVFTHVQFPRMSGD